MVLVDSWMASFLMVKSMLVLSGVSGSVGFSTTVPELSKSVSPEVAVPDTV